MFDYVHSVSHDEAIKSDDVLVQALAVLDSRLGKRRLEAFDDSALHPLAKKFLTIRQEAELHEIKRRLTGISTAAIGRKQSVA